MGAVISCFGHRPPVDQPPPLLAFSMAAGSTMGKREVELLKQDKKLQKLISGADPEEISGIGAYLLQHMNRDLDRQNYNRVEIAVNIIDLLLDNCRKVASWPLLVQNYFEMVKRLLQSDEPRLETMGTQLFQRHTKLHKDVGDGLAREYGIITQKFLAFMSRQNGDAKRMNGFVGIKVICCNLLFTHATRKGQRWARELFTKILAFLLIELFCADAAHFSADGPADEAGTATELKLIDSELDFHTLFVAFVRELVLRCQAESLNLLVLPMFKHITLTDCWNMANDYVTNFFVAIMAESGDEKLDQFLHCLIQHLRNVNKCASTYELFGMAHLLANFVPLVARPFDSDTKSLKSLRCDAKVQQQCAAVKLQKQNFMALLELLQMSLEMAKTRKDLKLVAAYQDKLIEAMNKLSTAMPDTMKLQTVISSGSPLPIMIADKPFFQAPPVVPKMANDE